MFDPDELEAIRESYARWEEDRVATAMDTYGERRDRFETDAEGFTVDRLYTPLDMEGQSYLQEIGFPGDPPYTRGVYETGYRGRLWTMRQYAGMGTANETNERFRYLLDEGQTGLSLAFDLPTQMGYDSDSELAAGEVGKSGVAIDTLADMERVFDDIPLDSVSTSMTINAPASILLAMYIAVGDSQGVPREQLRGTIQNDLLKEYIARNTYIYPPEPSMRIITDIFAFCGENLSKFNTISISGYHIREAGSTAPQELAFTLANAIEYIERAMDAGLDVDDFAPQLSFFFAAHNNILEEVAKFRAARRLYHAIMTTRFDAQQPASTQLKFHTQTGGSTLTAQQIDNNVVRVAYQALAAVLGGTQSLHTNSKDEALALPSEDAVKTALRTQQILAHESGVADTIDPLAGSYYVESLTDAIEEEARSLLDEIESRGGMLEAIEGGWVHRSIRSVAYERQAAVEAGDHVIVGVNRFSGDEKTHVDIQEVDPREEARQRDRLAAIKEQRDDDAVDEALEAVAAAARGDENLLPPIITAVKSYATVEEISDVLREVFGEYQGEGAS